MITKYIDENGLSVLLEPVSGMVSVSVGLWVKTGSRSELKSEYGYAHFVEHMLFKGTEQKSARDIARVVDRVGGQHNAATNREYTCYYINVISEYLELALEVLSDMFFNSVFDKTEIEKEKNVIVEEIRMYDDTPDELIHDLFMEFMMGTHPLAHSILGTEKTISSSSRESLVSYYNNHYSNENSILAIAGNFESEKVKDLVKKHFAQKRKSFLVAAPDGINTAERLRVKHLRKDLEQVHFCLGADGIKRNDPDRWALYAMSTILGGSMSSRLFQNIREKEGISYSIYSFHSSYSDQGIFGIYCASSPDKFDRAVELIVKECREIMKKGITTEELDDAKTFMIGNLALSMESSEVRMGQLAKNEMTYGKCLTFDENMEKIKNISMDDFFRVTGRVFAEKMLSIVSLGDISDKDVERLDLNL